MAQHDYNIANQSGAGVRGDINNVLSALATKNSGTGAPTTTFPFMWWFDTANALLKIRNGDDNAWVTAFGLAGTVWVPYSEGVALTTGTEIGDILRLVDLGDTAGTPALPAVDGSNLTGLDTGGVQVISISDFTSSALAAAIPADAKVIDIALTNVSVSTPASIGLRLGDAGGIESGSGQYEGYSHSSNSTDYDWNTYAYVAVHSESAETVEGNIRLVKGPGNIWTISVQTGAPAHVNETMTGAGSVTISDTLTQLQFLPSTGSFDGGAAEIYVFT